MTVQHIARLVLALGLLTLVAALPARSAEPEADFGPPISAALELHILPRHDAFAAAASDLSAAAAGFCAGDRSLEEVKTAYEAAMDGWMGIQHIAFGPIQSFNRRYRVQFWPDKRTAAPALFAKLLAEQPRDIFKPNGFTFAGVAVQGLPVVERLLYEGVPVEGYRCELLAAVSANVSAIADGLRSEWADGADSWGEEVRAAAAGGSDMLGLPQDVAGMLLGGLGGELKLIREYKVLAVLDGTPPESPFAQRSARNIVVNLEALAELYRLLVLPPLKAEDAKFAALLERAFAQTMATAKSVSGPLADAAQDPARRAVLETLATETGALRQIAAQKAADRLGLVLGFNALDGD